MFLRERCSILYKFELLYDGPLITNLMKMANFMLNSIHLKWFEIIWKLLNMNIFESYLTCFHRKSWWEKNFYFLLILCLRFFRWYNLLWFFSRKMLALLWLIKVYISQIAIYFCFFCRFQIICFSFLFFHF